MTAVNRGDMETIRYLFSRGADLNCYDKVNTMYDKWPN